MAALLVEPTQFAWPAILFGIAVFLYQHSLPYIQSERTYEGDSANPTRLFLLFWLSAMALCHTPLIMPIQDSFAKTFLALNVVLLLALQLCFTCIVMLELATAWLFHSLAQRKQRNRVVNVFSRVSYSNFLLTSTLVSIVASYYMMHCWLKESSIETSILIPEVVSCKYVSPYSMVLLDSIKSMLVRYESFETPFTLVGGGIILMLLNFYVYTRIVKANSQKKKLEVARPNDFLPMSEWYSLAMTDLAIQVIISSKLFLERFDIRMLQGAYNEIDFSSSTDINMESSEVQQGSTKTVGGVDVRFKNEEDLWFDWIADTGDGGDSTYTIARNLAQPSLQLKFRDFEQSKDFERAIASSDIIAEKSMQDKHANIVSLPRGRFFIIGGDLAYPTSSEAEYNRRLFRPFEYALESPIIYHDDGCTATSEARNGEFADIDASDKDQERKNNIIEPSSSVMCQPYAYAIPGNHDWYDGLHAFVHCICHRDWLGGWRMPQKKSYFSLRLPHGWWIFGLDYALNDDIDPLQYEYFLRIIKTQMKENDRVILACHEPTWILEAYDNYPSAHLPKKETASKNLKHLMRKYLKGRVAIRIAGDVHNYIRYDLETKAKCSEREGAASMLIVAGGGGAFLHPTDVFPYRLYETGAVYHQKSWYPEFKESRKVAYGNFGFGFRHLNWNFDLVAAGLYFLLVASFFPRCGVREITEQSTFTGGCIAFGNELFSMIGELFSEAILSLIVFVLMFLSWFGFADFRHGKICQLSIAGLHSLIHLLSAFSLFLLLELALQVMIEDQLAGFGYDKAFNFAQLNKRSNETLQFFRGILEPILHIVDIPENMAFTRRHLCTPSNSLELTRFNMVSYYSGSFLYMFIAAAHVGSCVFGLYLFVCSIVDLHWNEAYSALRNPHYKSFIRFKIDKDGDLHAFVIGIDKISSSWQEDPNWETTKERQLKKKAKTGTLPSRYDPDVASYSSKLPSRWISDTQDEQEKLKEAPRIVDYFCFKRTSTDTNTNGIQK